MKILASALTQTLKRIATASLFVFACLTLLAPAYAFASQGTVYSCTITPSYQHPVTHEIEDAGGKSAKVTGQAMVESCIKKRGMLEKTDAGEFYLTVRLSLIDHTSKHAFQVQSWGDSGWSDPRLGVTGTGKDKAGTTNDVTIQVPSQKCIVRVSMYVEDMGRTIICYLYPTNFKEGVPKGFTPAMVIASQSSPSASGGGSASKDTALDDVSQEAQKVSAEEDEEEEELDTTVVDTAQGLTLSTAAQVSESQVGLDGSNLAVVLALVLVMLCGVAFVAVHKLLKRAGRLTAREKDPDDYDYLYED